MAANRNRARPAKVPKQRITKPVGGYREGSGRGKRGYHRGVYCASTYELVWVIYRLDHGLPVVKFPGFIDMGHAKYYPDFVDGDTIYEIKGFWTPEVDIKRAAAENAGYKVHLLYKKDLTREFDWVKQRYIYSDVTELYDNFTPAYQYNCSNCSKLFTRHRKSRTDVVFCTRRCAGEGHQGSRT